MVTRIVVTGGTFDKVYNHLTGELVFRETHIPEILKIGRNMNKVFVEKLMLIDSLNMTEKDRLEILEKCESFSEDKIIIIHGTDTMVETAKVLGENLKGKTIVLTGAMVPHSIRDSDASFNFAFSLGAVQEIQKGVYIAMNGRTFRWDNVRKNKEKGEFEEIS